MAILIIVALLVSGIPTGSTSMPCASCCDGARVVPDDADGPPCCKLTPDTPQQVARPAPASAAVIVVAATDRGIAVAGPSLRIKPFASAVPFHPPPTILRI